MNFKRPIILASSSPRRRLLMQSAGYRFSVVKPNINERYPTGLQASKAPLYLAEKKALSLRDSLVDNTILLAADTMVLLGRKVLNKPKDKQEAISMLSRLSDKKHTVVTGVCLLDSAKIDCFHDATEVVFKPLAKWEIEYYVERCELLDKAGGYGIQDWIGLVGVQAIYGSYSTVVGLPMHKVHEHLQAF